LGTAFSHGGATSSTWVSHYHHGEHHHGDADHRVAKAQSGIADCATHRTTEHHAGDLADHHQTQDQEQGDEKLCARTADVGDDVRGEQYACDRAEHNTDERQYRAQCTGTPSRDRSDERDRKDGHVEPLGRCHSWASPSVSS
jgi:hypothetical protein